MERKTAGGPKWTKMTRLTNEQKQQLKPLASTLDRETDRIKIKELRQNLSKAEQDAIKNFQNVLDMKLGDLKDSYNLTNDDMYELLCPFLTGANIVSKIGVPLDCKLKDRRHVGWKLMVAMRRVFGISIDELLDECFQSLPDREPPKK